MRKKYKAILVEKQPGILLRKSLMIKKLIESSHLRVEHQGRIFDESVYISLLCCILPDAWYSLKWDLARIPIFGQAYFLKHFATN